MAGPILGVDPGLSATGWGLLDPMPDGTAQLRWSVIRPPKPAEADLATRLAFIHDQVSDVIARHKPAALAIERPFVHRNVRSAVALGQAQAAAMMAAAKAGIPVAEYPPREVKQTVAGDGAADKQVVAQALVARLGLAELNAPSDAADALAVAYCHYLSVSQIELAAS